MTNERELREALEDVQELRKKLYEAQDELAIETRLKEHFREVLEREFDERRKLNREINKLKKDLREVGQLNIRTANYEITINRDRDKGFFEHVLLGEDQGGELIFKNNFNGIDELIDYDGVYSLSREVVDALEVEGFDISYVNE